MHLVLWLRVRPRAQRSAGRCRRRRRRRPQGSPAPSPAAVHQQRAPDNRMRDSRHQPPTRRAEREELRRARARFLFRFCETCWTAARAALRSRRRRRQPPVACAAERVGAPAPRIATISALNHSLCKAFASRRGQPTRPSPPPPADRRRPTARRAGAHHVCAARRAPTPSAGATGDPRPRRPPSRAGAGSSRTLPPGARRARQGAGHLAARIGYLAAAARRAHGHGSSACPAPAWSCTSSLCHLPLRPAGAPQ